MADLEAGATGTMPSALLPDLIKPVLEHFRAGRRAEAAAAYARILPLINYENRQCGLRATKTVMAEGGVIKSDAVRHPLAPLRSGDARRPARARRELNPLALRWGRSGLTGRALLDAARTLSGARQAGVSRPRRACVRPTPVRVGAVRDLRHALRRGNQARRAAGNESRVLRDDADRRAVRRDRCGAGLDGDRCAGAQARRTSIPSGRSKASTAGARR